MKISTKNESEHELALDTNETSIHGPEGSTGESLTSAEELSGSTLTYDAHGHPPNAKPLTDWTQTTMGGKEDPR